MRLGLYLLLVLAVVAVAAWYKAQPTFLAPASQQGCDEGLWQHVYNPSRLEVRDRCKTVTGTIANVRNEADGDQHVRLALDAGQEGLLNDKNRSDQAGDLVVEPVCTRTVTQDDAKAACAGYVSPITVPPVGTHVAVTGAYVLDHSHGWMEIHPISVLRVT